jgi:hypothetical protein
MPLFAVRDGRKFRQILSIIILCINVFGREPDLGGFDFWYQEMALDIHSQVDVLVNMMQSNEYVNTQGEAIEDSFFFH